MDTRRRLENRCSASYLVGYPSGWEQILDELDEAISGIDPRYTISQVKVKFGGLRFYFRMSEKSTPEDFDAVRELVTYAEDRAAKTCMICGEPGTLGIFEQVCCPAHWEDK